MPGNFFAAAFLRGMACLPLAAIRVLARAVATVLRNSHNKHRRIAAINIALTHPALDAVAQKALVDRSLEQSLCTSLEMPLVWHHDNAWIEKKILRVEADQHMRDALAQGRGVLLICPHIGNWEVLGRYLPRYAPTTSLYQPPRYSALETLVKNGRERSGAILVPTSQRGVAQLLKALQRGEIVGMLPDQVPKGSGGVFAPFFGVPAYTMTLLHKLLQRTGCRAVMGYALREDDGFAIIFKAAPAALYNEDLQQSATALNQLIESATTEDPGQYQWAYKRFKVQPDGSNPYATE
ncbi:MAG: lysophospholipid acyltransferase family protein [Pseudomonadales bacterium]